MKEATLARINAWLEGDYDQDSKAEITRLQKENPKELEESFYKNLEFGTGGLRGLMGVGTNKMNKYTVGMATQGYANYLKKVYGDEPISVAIAHDCRNNSRFFAETTAHVFAANGIKVYLFDALRPTPELSFTIRLFGCKGGVVCTASHNPKEYNGYKAYWNDGAQVVPPHDKNIITEVDQVKLVSDVKWTGNDELIQIIGDDVDQKYIAMAKSLSVYPDVIEKQHDLKIAYASIHGSGIMLVPKVLKAYGFDNVHVVKEQEKPDGNFPTVVYPNPEEPSAMKLGLDLAASIDADILLGTDPDADRVAVAVKNKEGKFQLLNGNQTLLLVFSYLIEARKEKGIATPKDFVCKTIVTTDMANVVAEKNDVKCYDVLTGFKWIAEKILLLQGKENYVVGGEESFGVMIGDNVRDKDSITAVAMLCEMAAYEKNKGRSLFDKLIDLYVQYGFYLEKLVYIVRQGMDGQEQIAKMMSEYRSNPPKTLNGHEVVKIVDVKESTIKDLKTGKIETLDLPKSNVLQYYTADGTKISVRPSGTEPKIKYYFSVHTTLESADKFETTEKELHAKIDAIVKEMGLDK